LFFAALATGDMEKAAGALNKIRAAQGDSDITANLDGLYKLSMLDVEGAEAAFVALSVRNPDFAPAKINLARVRAMTGRQAEAEKILTEILAKEAGAEPALTMLTAAYVQAGKLQQATEVLDRAHKADPGNVRITSSMGDLYIRAGTPQKALDLISTEKGSNATATEIMSLRAAAQLALGLKKDARDTYTELLKNDPQVVGARRQLTALLIEAGDFESARSTLTGGIAADPRNYQLYQDMALVDLRATGVEAALVTAERLMLQDRDFPAIHALKGDVYMAANRPLDATVSYSEAMKTHPSDLLANRLAGALVRARRTEDAVKVLADWSDKHPDDLPAKEQLGELYIALNDIPNAGKYLEQILVKKPYDPIALNNLAWVYQQLGQNDKAQSLARKAYVLSPGAQTADTLGWILTTSGKASVGLTLLRQASVEAQADPRIQYHFGVALKETGAKDEAKKVLTAVAESKGDFKEKQEAIKVLDQMK